MAFGVIVLVGFAIYSNQKLLKEYPYVNTTDNLADTVTSLTKERGAAMIIFQSGKKVRFTWAKNNLYHDFPNLVDMIELDDVVNKRKNSDTIFVEHGGKKYYYIIDREINGNTK
jgi:hypothetical protein